MDRSLLARAIAVVRALRGLSEVGAVNYEGDRVKGGGSKSSPPPGARLGQRGDLRDLSLADYWADRFKSARSERQLTVFILLAELDHKRATRRQPQRDPHEDREVRERRIIEQYEGLSDLEAALAEDCSESYIRKVRKALG